MRRPAILKTAGIHPSDDIPPKRDARGKRVSRRDRRAPIGTSLQTCATIGANLRLRADRFEHLMVDHGSRLVVECPTWICPFFD